VIVCLRTALVPPQWTARYLVWMQAGGELRKGHGILAELVCEPTDPAGDIVVIAV